MASVQVLPGIPEPPPPTILLSLSQEEAEVLLVAINMVSDDRSSLASILRPIRVALQGKKALGWVPAAPLVRGGSL